MLALASPTALACQGQGLEGSASPSAPEPSDNGERELANATPTRVEEASASSAGEPAAASAGPDAKADRKADVKSADSGAFAVGNDDADIWGGLAGTEVGEAYGVGGLGLVGTGRGGSGTGEGTIGLGNTGLIGKGGGGGTGSGYGRGAGAGFGARAPDMTPLNPSATGDDYAKQDENPFKNVRDAPLSTFSIKVDA